MIHRRYLRYSLYLYCICIYTLLWFHKRHLGYSLYLYCICIYTLLWFHRRYLRYSVSLVACCRRRSIFASSVREGSDLGSDFVFFVFDVFFLTIWTTSHPLNDCSSVELRILPVSQAVVFFVFNVFFHNLNRTPCLEWFQSHLKDSSSFSSRWFLNRCWEPKEL